MLISTSTDPISEIGSVATSSFEGFAPFFYLVAGVVFAIFVVEVVFDVVERRKSDRIIEATISRSRAARDL